jgi:hypothetical protein
MKQQSKDQAFQAQNFKEYGFQFSDSGRNARLLRIHYIYASPDETGKGNGRRMDAISDSRQACLYAVKGALLKKALRGWAVL